MRNKLTLSIILLFLLSGFIPLKGQGLILQKDIVVEEGEVEDNVISFGGEVIIRGLVTETVLAFGGTILIEGEVEGSVVGIGSNITLESTARVGEDIVVIGGILKKESGSTIGGDTVQFGMETPEDVREFLREGLGGFLGMRLIPFLLVLKLISMFIWFILALLLAAIFPRQIAHASSQIRAHFWPVFGVGLLGIIAGLLSLILIGIPVLIALVFLGIVIKIFGRVTVFCFFGQSLSRAFGSKNPTTIGSVILGFVIVSFIGFIPILGSLFYLVLSCLGWGSVIKTKFGTKTPQIQPAPSA